MFPTWYRARLLGVALAVLLPTATFAQALAPCDPVDAPQLSARDVERLANLGQARLRGLSAAMSAESSEDRMSVAGLYANGLAPAEPVPSGAYFCKTIKLGGNLPLIVYENFDCTIEYADGDYTIDKTSGSQLFSGSLTPSGDGLLYVGALHYSDEGPMDYVGDTERDQVGCLSRVSLGGNSFVLELPSPQFESLHDVILLVPKDR